jgi:hypothetical protein
MSTLKLSLIATRGTAGRDSRAIHSAPWQKSVDGSCRALILMKTSMHDNRTGLNRQPLTDHEEG